MSRAKGVAEVRRKVLSGSTCDAPFIVRSTDSSEAVGFRTELCEMAALRDGAGDSVL